MMTAPLRIILIVASLAVAFGILTRIRHSKMRIEDSIFWLVVSLICILFSVFPGIAYSISHAIGIFDSTNFVFLFFIALLLLKVFQMSIQVSQLNGKVRTLTQELACLKYDAVGNNLAESDGANAIEPSTDDGPTSQPSMKTE